MPVQILDPIRKVFKHISRHEGAIPPAKFEADPPRRIPRQHRHARRVTRIVRRRMPDSAVQHQRATGWPLQLHLPGNGRAGIDAVVHVGRIARIEMAARIADVQMTARHNPGAPVFSRKFRQHPQRGEAHGHIGKRHANRACAIPIQNIVRPIRVKAPAVNIFFPLRSRLKFGLCNPHVRIQHRLCDAQHALVAKIRREIGHISHRVGARLAICVGLKRE